MNKLKTEYTLKFCTHVQNVVSLRKSLRVTQSKIAYESGVSLRTIQNFENYNCEDYYLIFAYNTILSNIG